MTAQAACTGGSDSTRLKAAGQGTRGAHFEHAAHGCDARRVEAERLVERRRVLPSRKAGMRRGTRYGPGGVRAAQATCTRRGSDSRFWGLRACAERTENMWLMSVTLDVSKLSGWLNAYAYCRVERRACDAGRVTAREA